VIAAERQAHPHADELRREAEQDDRCKARDPERPSSEQEREHAEAQDDLRPREDDRPVLEKLRTIGEPALRARWNGQRVGETPDRGERIERTDRPQLPRAAPPQAARYITALTRGQRREVPGPTDVTVKIRLRT